MKFENYNLKFHSEEDFKEFLFLFSNENEFIEKSKFLIKFQNEIDENLIKEKWNRATNGKRMRKKIKENLEKLEKNEELKYFDFVDLLTILSSIKTHLYLEMKYYDTFEKISNFLSFLKILIKKINKIENNIFDNIFNENSNNKVDINEIKLILKFFL